MRQAGVLLAVALAGAAGCEIRDDQQGGLGGLDVSGAGLSADDDGCGTLGCCAGVRDDSGFRCSDDESPHEDGLPPPQLDGDSDESTGSPEHVCTSNVIVDGGFELGTPSRAWDEFASVLNTPICNGDCSTGVGPVPFGGEWFAWFGGVQQPAQASLTQVFTLTADTAQLRFHFGIGEAAGTGDDRFAVLVDGNTVFMRTDADIEDFPPYTVVPVTLDQWADGQPHELRLESEVFGDGLTNFLVDEVELVGCGAVEMPADSSGGAVDETGTTAASGTTDGGTTSGSTTSGSTMGGSTTGDTGTTTGGGSGTATG